MASLIVKDIIYSNPTEELVKLAKIPASAA